MGRGHSGRSLGKGLFVYPQRNLIVPTVSPSYTPFYTWSGAGGVNGDPISGWSDIGTPNRLFYSNAVTGPFGGSIVGENRQTFANEEFFGGVIVLPSGLGHGDHLWWRFYTYFPSNFCFSYGSNPEGASMLKWMRYDTPSGRMYPQYIGQEDPYKLLAYPSCGILANPGRVESELSATHWIVHEAERTANPYTLLNWQAMQCHVYLHDSAGYIELWMGANYLGKTVNENDYDGNNNWAGLTCNIGDTVDAIVFGDYWNGGAPKVQTFYIDEFIMTSETPNTLDSGGRPYISPTAQVADF